MSDSGPFSDRDIERDLRDLGARIEYPPTPDLSRAVRRRIDEEGAHQQVRRGGFWPSLLSPRLAVPAAALVMIAVAIFSPAVRGTLSDLFASDEGSSGQRAGDSAARPDSVRPESAGEPVARDAQASSAGPSGAATGCPSLSLDATPARAAPEGSFRLHGEGLSGVCDEARSAQDINIAFRQGGKTWRLASVDADRDLTFDVKLRVPAGAHPGRATVRATTRSGELADVRFAVLG